VRSGLRILSAGGLRLLSLPVQRAKLSPVHLRKTNRTKLFDIQIVTAARGHYTSDQRNHVAARNVHCSQPFCLELASPFTSFGGAREPDQQIGKGRIIQGEAFAENAQ
jgi:hypothetical protein